MINSKKFLRRFSENIVSIKGYTKKLMEGKKKAMNWQIAKGAPDAF